MTCGQLLAIQKRSILSKIKNLKNKQKIPYFILIKYTLFINYLSILMRIIMSGRCRTDNYRKEKEHCSPGNIAEKTTLAFYVCFENIHKPDGQYQKIYGRHNFSQGIEQIIKLR